MTRFPWKLWVGSVFVLCFCLVCSLDFTDVQAAKRDEWREVNGQPTAAIDSATAGNSPQNPTIIGGNEAAPDAWPWMVALVFADNENVEQGQFCGGALIHEEWVLTAAHCTFEFNGRARKASDIDVVVGRHRLNATEGVRVHVQQIIRHAGYTMVSFDSDLALLHLATPVNYPTIAPLTVEENALEAHNTPAVVIGWGVTDDGSASNVLREVTVPLVDLRTCRQSYGIFNEKVTDNMICAGRKEGGIDSCQGDSGGPLMVFDEQSTTWRQVGIVSWGDGCAAPNYYGVYTRVSSFTGWIQQQIPALVQPTTTPTASGTPTPMPSATATPTFLPTATATLPTAATPTATVTLVMTTLPTPTSTFVPTTFPTTMATPTNTFVPTAPAPLTPTALPTVDSAGEPTVVPSSGGQQLYFPLVMNAQSGGIRSGSFETISPEGGWSEFSLQQRVLIRESQASMAMAHTGAHLVEIGSTRREVAYVYQDIRISATAPILEYWFMIQSEDDCGYDFGGVVVNDIVVDKFDLCLATATPHWYRRLVNLSHFVGMEVTLEMRGETDRFLDSTLLIDDVSLRSFSASVSAAADNSVMEPLNQPIQRADRAAPLWAADERSAP